MNDRSQLTTQERFHHRQLVRDPEAIVHRTLSLFRSDDWADLVVGGDGYWAATH